MRICLLIVAALFVTASAPQAQGLTAIAGIKVGHHTRDTIFTLATATH